jgi:uncharacterized YigZ family protein
MAYLAPAGSARFEQEIKRSRFLGVAVPARSDEDVARSLDEIRREFPDATHHCWASILGDPDKSARMRMDDDGEPSGTAGRPILSVLQHKRVGDVLLVVVRYFGGRKLGAGGLVRAYSSTASGVLDRLPTAESRHMALATVRLDYHDEEPARRLLGAEGVEILGVRFESEVLLDVRLEADQIPRLTSVLSERTRGRARLTVRYSDGLSKEPI